MVSAEKYPFQSLATASFFLSPIAGSAWLLTGSPAAGVAAAMFAWAAWSWPVAVFWALVASAPLVRSGNAAVLSPMLISQVKAGAALLFGLIWLARKTASGENPGFPRWVTVYLGAWVALTALAVLHGTEWRNSLEYLAFSTAGLVVFCAGFDLDRKQKRAVVWTALALGGAIGALVMLQYLIVVYHVAPFLERFIVEPRTQAYFSSNLTPLAADRYRPTGTMTHPNAMGLYFAVLIPFACALIPIRGLRARYRLGLGLAAAAMVLGLYATNSRGAVVCLVVSLAYLSLHAGYRWMAILGGGALLAVLAVLHLGGSSLSEALLSKARLEYGLSGRLTVWENSLDLVRQAPFLGVGPGNFSHQYVSHFGYFTPNDINEQAGQIWAMQTQGEEVVNNYHSHNTYLQLLGEAGAAAPLLFLIGLFGVLAHCERIGRAAAIGGYGRSLALATAAGAAGLLIYGMFDSQLGFTLGSLNLLAGALLAFGLKPGEKDYAYAI
jgi:O-antigen ligase